MSHLYPLGHQPNEVGRLEIQASLLEDPWLADLAKGHQRALEIGAGVGSNLSSLLRANPRIHYRGVDFSPLAVRNARKLHPERKAEFQVMDATALEFSDNHFDLVFSKLVLWSIGKNWKTAVAESFRVLRPGGSFYAFEPVGKAMAFHPPRPHLQALIERWDENAGKKGLDTNIGWKLPSTLEEVGFKNIQVKFFPVLGTHQNRERYRAICDNLKKFYFGESLPDLKLDSGTLRKASEELMTENNDQMVLDAFLVVTGVK